ncbi:AMM_1a_G0033090.mRNA.1.CDS.1 [Saccharomyces cerevisiae]|nr:hypothetical protein H756_YJM428K00199 [Saccharomyces cerevisiae YJM428]AJS43940.1 hypothetical protein H792_YJM1304K00199 [Saccharomyces cerevisiae YJM1304]AJS52593.1 hypothetical protein H821_YJM1443K00199 [Saccharomyces cerevisiae YJM1443]CAI4585662.1 AMM_1a_G0033090.mRNA.1.CDS.1 [Saccharomyces cerevisiae]CAI4601651.1 BAP_1a_G0033110.mRNA.1.CDS.1 [Saccharomyces cerevisiae]
MNPRYRFILRFYSSKKPTFHNTAPSKTNVNVPRANKSQSKGKHKGKLLVLVGTLALVTSVVSVNYQKNEPVEFLE